MGLILKDKRNNGVFMDKNKKTVLIVDDSLESRAFMGLKLRHAGYDVLLAEDGFQGIKELENNDGVSLVILDIMMPKMNGIQMLNRLKLKMKILKEKSTLDLGTVEMLDDDAAQEDVEEDEERIKVLICSAKSDDGTIDIFMEAGADDFIVKPVKESVLLEKVGRLVGKEKEKFARLKTDLSISIKDEVSEKQGKMVELSELSVRLDIKDRLKDGSKVVIKSSTLDKELKKPVNLKGHVVYSEKNMKNQYDTEITLELDEDSKTILRGITTSKKSLTD